MENRPTEAPVTLIDHGFSHIGLPRRYCPGERVEHIIQFNPDDFRDHGFFCRAFPTDTALDIFIAISDITEAEVKGFYGPMVFRQYVNRYKVPFFVVGSARFAASFSLDLNDLRPESRLNWLTSEDNMITVALIEKQDMTLCGLRSMPYPYFYTLRQRMEQTLCMPYPNWRFLIKDTFERLNAVEMGKKGDCRKQYGPIDVERY